MASMKPCAPSVCAERAYPLAAQSAALVAFRDLQHQRQRYWRKGIALRTFCQASPSDVISRTDKYRRRIVPNEDGVALRKLQAGVNKVADVVGVTLGPKGRNVVMPRTGKNEKPGYKIINDGLTVAREVELEDVVENLGATLIKDLAFDVKHDLGDGSTTCAILAKGFINEGVKLLRAGANAAHIASGMQKTVAGLVKELKSISTEVKEEDVADVAAISSSNDYDIGNMVAEAMRKVGPDGEVTIDIGKHAETTLQIVEGVGYDKGYFSPYFVKDKEETTIEFDNCQVLLIDEKVTSAEAVTAMLDNVDAVSSILIVAHEIDQAPLTTLLVNNGQRYSYVAVRPPGFGHRMSDYIGDIATLTGATVVGQMVGLPLDKIGEEVLGLARKVVVTKNRTTIIGTGTNKEAIQKRIVQIDSMVQCAGWFAERDLLKQRIASLRSGIAVIWVGGQTEIEQHDRKLRFEDALNSVKSAREEGIVAGGGTTLLKLSKKVDAIKDTLKHPDEKVGADIVKKGLRYPVELIADNAGIDGSVVVEKLLANDNFNYGYNAATGAFEDLMVAGVIDPTKVVRCCLEKAASTAWSFLKANGVVANVFKPNVPKDACGVLLKVEDLLKGRVPPD